MSVSFVVWISTLIGFILPQPAQKRAMSQSNGPVTEWPTSFAGRFITPIHLIPTVLLPTSYIIGYPLLPRQPTFLVPFNLPQSEYQDLLRVGACVGCIATGYALSVVFDTLAGNLHFIAVRENPKLVSTGPYAVVRHPLYSLVIASHLFA